MFKLFIRATRLSVLVVWAFFAISFIQPFSAQWQELIFWSGIILLVAHFLEYIALCVRIEKFGGRGWSAFIGTMVFGYGYWLPLFKK